MLDHLYDKMQFLCKLRRIISRGSLHLKPQLLMCNNLSLGRRYRFQYLQKMHHSALHRARLVLAAAGP